MTAALVFLSAFAADWVWIVYMRKAAERKAVGAAFWSGFLILLAGFNIIEYTGNHWLIAASWSGAVLGTYSAIRWGPK